MEDVQLVMRKRRLALFGHVYRGQDPDDPLRRIMTKLRHLVSVQEADRRRPGKSASSKIWQLLVCRRLQLKTGLHGELP